MEARTSLALWLRSGRAQRGLSIDDVSRVTKIQPRILERLESGKAEGLPADVFVRGFVRSFARCVGLDEDEALERYATCGATDASTGRASVEAPPVARAIVDAMSDLAPATALASGSAGDLPIMLHELPDLSVETLEPRPVEAPPVEVIVEAPVVMAPPADIDLTALEAPVPAAAPAKKKRTRRVAEGTTPTKTRKRKVIATGTPVEATPVVTEPAPEIVVAPDVPLEPIAVVEADAAAFVGAVAIEEATPAIDPPAVEADTTAGEPWRTVDASAAIVDVVASDDVAATEVVTCESTWTPKMPPLPIASPPWRRGAQPALVAVIDDADPESAERALEDRRDRDAKRTFLPPILLDREDRSARQGGLTLAVIILLIAATLTLSYLMRRPSASGDGVTRAAAKSHVIA